LHGGTKVRPEKRPVKLGSTPSGNERKEAHKQEKKQGPAKNAEEDKTAPPAGGCQRSWYQKCTKEKVLGQTVGEEKALLNPLLFSREAEGGGGRCGVQVRQKGTRMRPRKKSFQANKPPRTSLRKRKRNPKRKGGGGLEVEIPQRVRS